MKVTYVKSKYRNNFGDGINDTEFNQQHFDQLMAKQDLFNAAEYAAQFRYDNEDLEMQNRFYINNLRKDAKRRERAIKNMSDAEKDAYAFNYAVTHNLLLPTEDSTGRKNKFTEQFINLKNSIGGKGSDSLTITIKNNKNDFYNIFEKNPKTTADLFFSELGIKKGNEANIQELFGATSYSNEQGDHVFTISKANPKILDVLLAYSRSNLNNNNIDLYGTKNGKRVFTPDDSPMTSNYLSQNDRDIYNKTDTRSKLQSMFYALDTVKRLADPDKMTDSERKEFSTQRSMILTGTMSAGHAKLIKDYSNGLINETQFRLGEQMIKNSMDKLLETAFSQNKVYWNDSPDDVLRFADVDTRTRLEDIFRSARDENREISYQSAMVGGVNGTYITIAPQEKYSLFGSKRLDGRPDEEQRTTKIFIPDMLKGDTERAFYADPKTRAIQEIEQMTADGYEYSTAEGDIRSLGGDKYAITKQVGIDENNKPIYQDVPISKLDAQYAIAEEMSLNDTISRLQQYMTNEDNEVDNKFAAKALMLNADYIKSQVIQLYNITDPNLLNTYAEDYLTKVCNILGIDKDSIKL